MELGIIPHAVLAALCPMQQVVQKSRLRASGLFFFGEKEEVRLARDFAIKFYNSAAWQRCRRAYAQSVYGLCERCGEPGLEVHHKIHLTPANINDPAITLGWDNLELLCAACHNKVHKRQYEAVRDDVMFDASGDLVRR